MKRYYFAALAVCMGLAAAGQDSTAADENVEKAVSNISHAITIIDSTWDKSVCGSTTNTYVADSYDLDKRKASGASDVWPYTAAIEGHCAILEALKALKDADAKAYDENFSSAIEKYTGRLNRLIENLEYYRGTYMLTSYTGSHSWSPYAVPRAGSKGGANVSGILNVYDDQMWLCRELIRAYRITDNTDYRDLAAYLADYVIDGWDCWHDADGKEYGGITWGPGYNSKHACSNAPIIQPLVWLSDIYKDSEETMTYATRTESNAVKRETLRRAEVYLTMAKKVYDWQYEKLRHESGVYWDMMGADNTIKVSRGARQHVDCGDAVGNFYSYNTGTMIAGAAELYRVTGEQRYLTDMETSIAGAFKEFHRMVGSQRKHEMKTDQSASSGFNTWFNNVLFRAYIDADLYLPANGNLQKAIDGHQYCLDYAMDKRLKDDQLPIKLLNGWGSDTMTKAFHQFSFVSEMSMLAVKNLRDAARSGIESVAADGADATLDDAKVYTLSGVLIGRYADVKESLQPGIYLCNGRKIRL